MKSKFMLVALVISTGLLPLTGCDKTPAVVKEDSRANPKTDAASKPAPLTTEQMTKFKVNEAGVVPILEYHDVKGTTDALFSRSVASFKADLERLYREGYRPVSSHDYLNNKINTPIGTTPVIFTFDDARESQFRYLPDGTLDPDCAVGILQAFAKEHPDFPVRASFFVLPTHPGFGSPDVRAKKFQALLDMGCEIGNHTITHTALRKLSDENVQKEIGGCVKEINTLVPSAKVDTFALPLGIHPKNRMLEAAGVYNGQAYANRAVLLNGAEPAPSPISAKFNPLRLPRIIAFHGPMTTDFWLDELARHPARRYISDGDANAVTVPKSAEAKIDTAKLNGATLRTYEALTP